MRKAFIVAGSPGAGKSVYARDLAAVRHAVVLDIDIVTGRLVELALSESGHDPSDRDSPHFKSTFREPIYQTLFDIARENLSWSEVVIAGPFTHEMRDREWPAKVSKLLCAPVEVHYVYCAPSERRRRLEERGHHRDRAKLIDWDRSCAYYGKEDPPVFEHVFVDTTRKD